MAQTRKLPADSKDDKPRSIFCCFALLFYRQEGSEESKKRIIEEAMEAETLQLLSPINSIN